MKTNKVIPLILITIIAISSLGPVNAITPDFGSDSLGWLPIHFWDYQSGSYQSFIYAQVKVNGVVISEDPEIPYWKSSGRSNYHRADLERFNLVDKRINEVNTFEVRFYIDRLGFHETCWTQYHTFKYGDYAKIRTDTYWSDGYTDLEIWKNEVRLETVRS
ncbi:MAG: hypothetical protein LBB45_06005 [Methanobrevibacter sp.]|nr:hypothetical protein [Candidatus Methanovirga basalitermitum]